MLNEGGGEEEKETPGPGRGHLLLPLEPTKQDEVWGRACDSGSAPDAG